MRILQVITDLRTGGAENLIVQMVPMMIARGHEVEVAVFNGVDTPFKRQLEGAGVRIHSFSNGGSVYNPVHIFRLWKLMKRFDIVHTHNTAPQLFAAVANMFHVSELVTTEHTTSNRRRDMKWYASIDKWMYQGYRRVICISKKAEENLRKFIGSDSDSIVTIDNGIDVRRFSEAKPIKKICEDLPLHASVIVMVAGFRWEKDQPTLIRALTLLPEKFHLILVGDGYRREEFEILTEELNLNKRVHFLGLRNDIPEILKASDFVVMSSHFEGLSLSSLEGMASHKPFLASDVDGLREVVGGAGVLFEHENSRDLADKILALESDDSLRTRTVSASVNRVQSYSIDKMVDAYMAEYDKISGQ